MVQDSKMSFFWDTPSITTQNKFMCCELILLCRIYMCIYFTWVPIVNQTTSTSKWIKLPIRKEEAYNCYYLTNIKIKEIEILVISPLFGYNIIFSALQLFRFWIISIVEYVSFVLFIYSKVYFLLFDTTHNPNSQFNIRRKLNFRIVEFKWEKVLRNNMDFWACNVLQSRLTIFWTYKI